MRMRLLLRIHVPICQQQRGTYGQRDTQPSTHQCRSRSTIRERCSRVWIRVVIMELARTLSYCTECTRPPNIPHSFFVGRSCFMQLTTLFHCEACNVARQLHSDAVYGMLSVHNCFSPWPAHTTIVPPPSDALFQRC